MSTKFRDVRDTEASHPTLAKQGLCPPHSTDPLQEIVRIVHSIRSIILFPPTLLRARKETLPRSKKLPYKAVALGGTFDMFHPGHERLISTGFQMGRKVFIGVTSDSFVQTLRKRHSVQPYASRVKTLMIFLRANRWFSRAVILPLQDPYGPAATRRDIEALLVTPDTLPSAKKLNRLRKKRALPVLKIHKVPISKADDGRPISSTRIRKREIDRQGRVLGH